MPEKTVQGIGRIEPENRAEAVYQMFYNTEAHEAAAGRAGSHYRAEKAEEKPTPPPTSVNRADTFLKFSVDEETNDVTVYIVDRATKEVLRSIPPEEVSKLKAGDLLKLLA